MRLDITPALRSRFSWVKWLFMTSVRRKLSEMYRISREMAQLISGKISVEHGEQKTSTFCASASSVLDIFHLFSSQYDDFDLLSYCFSV